MMKKCVVTGLSLSSSLGLDLEENWQNILQGRSNLTVNDSPFFAGLDLNHFAFWNFNIDKIKPKFNKFILNEIHTWNEKKFSKDFYCILDNIYNSLEDACLEVGDGKDVSLILVHENFGFEDFCERIRRGSSGEFRDLKKFFSTFNKDVYNLQTFMPLFHIAKLFNIHGPSFFLNNACSSGLYAIDFANYLISSGQSKKVIIAGADFQGAYKLLWGVNSGLYSKGGVVRPFDKLRDGFIFGEGGGAIVLQEDDSCFGNINNAYAEYIGGAFNLEGWKVTLPNLSDHCLEEAIRGALRVSELDVDKIDLIGLHGVGTIVNDIFEGNSISKVFPRDRLQESRCISFKSYIGHLLGASSLADLILSLKSFKEEKAPPVLNLKNIDSKFSNLTFSKEVEKKRFQYLLKISNSFAGFNAAVIFKRYIK